MILLFFIDNTASDHNDLNQDLLIVIDGVQVARNTVHRLSISQEIGQSWVVGQLSLNRVVDAVNINSKQCTTRTHFNAKKIISK